MDVLRFPCSFSILSIPASGALAAGSAPSHPHPAGAHNDVPASDELQAHLEHGDVQEVDEVAQVIHQQPEVDVVCVWIGRPSARDQPAAPVPGQHHREQPQDVHIRSAGRGEEGARTSAREGSLCAIVDVGLLISIYQSALSYQL